VFEALEEIRSYSKNKNVNNQRIEELEDRLTGQKYLIRALAVGIIIVTIVLIV